MVNDSKHIQEKTVVEHLAKARQKGYLASVELHNYGFSSKLFSFTDAFRDGLVIFALIELCLSHRLWPLALGFTLYRGLKVTLQGFNRLERLHYLIKEEKYEIDHHREEERQELLAIYEAKGFKGTLLEEVVATLMADDNRLLQVMLEEELGVSFEVLDHPAVSGFMAISGMLAALFMIAALSLLPFGIYVGSFVLMGTIALYESKKQKLPSFNNVIWSLSSLLFVLVMAYFINKLVG
jgi:VIT1/CCC1 family predicted Fe2+/Mn2+ transporter